MTPATLLAFLRTARGHGINLTQLISLVALREYGPMNCTALAKGMGITPGGLTPISDSLVASGYVTRLPADDRRIVNLALTESGHDTIVLILSALEPLPA